MLLYLGNRAGYSFAHNFSTISRCGVNGHLAFGVMWAASRLRNASRRDFAVQLNGA